MSVLIVCCCDYENKVRVLSVVRGNNNGGEFLLFFIVNIGLWRINYIFLFYIF